MDSRNHSADWRNLNRGIFKLEMQKKKVVECQNDVLRKMEIISINQKMPVNLIMSFARVFQILLNVLIVCWKCFRIVR